MEAPCASALRIGSMSRSTPDLRVKAATMTMSWAVRNRGLMWFQNGSPSAPVASGGWRGWRWSRALEGEDSWPMRESVVEVRPSVWCLTLDTWVEAATIAMS